MTVCPVCDIQRKEDPKADYELVELRGDGRALEQRVVRKEVVQHGPGE